MVTKSNINGGKIPPGQLVNIIQKGIMYANLERSVADDGADVPSTEPFSLLRGGAEKGLDGTGAATASDSKGSRGGTSAEPSPMEASDIAPAHIEMGKGAVARQAEDTPEEQVTTLAGHTSEVFICAWSPSSLQLASGSGDSTARIWRVPDGPCGKGQVGRAIFEPAAFYPCPLEGVVVTAGLEPPAFPPCPFEGVVRRE